MQVFQIAFLLLAFFVTTNQTAKGARRDDEEAEADGSSDGASAGGESECKDQAKYCPTMEFHACYYKEYTKTCCERCKSKYDASKPGCEYGDSHPWCPDYVKGKKECDYLKTYEKCCDTCAKYMDGNSDGSENSNKEDDEEQS